MAPTKYERFIGGQLSGDLSEVPGLGEKGQATLKSKNIKTTYQLIGHFLKLNRNEAEFCKFLVECGGVEQHVKEAARAINERVADKGFECDIRLSDHVIKTAASRFDDTKKTDFLKRKLSNKLSDDFVGIRDETRYHASGIKTTDNLFGAFLSIIDDPSPAANTDKCDEFYRKLDALGAAPGYKSVIIYQLQAKLAVGIDTHGPEALKLRHLLPAMREVDEAALDEEAFDAREAGPRSVGSVKYTSRRTETPTPDSTKKKLDYEEAAPAASKPVLKPAEKPGEKTGAFLPVALFGVGLAVGAYFLLFSLGESGGPAALPKPEAGEWL